MSIKKTLLIGFIFVCLFFYFYAIKPLQGLDGFILNDFNLIYCKNEVACWHEVGHFVDSFRGYVSYKPEFTTAITDYNKRMLILIYQDLASEINTEIFATIKWIYNMPISKSKGILGFSPSAEIYAEIYRITRSDLDKIPLEFKEFYR
jgi:hypothetical protein